MSEDLEALVELASRRWPEPTDLFEDRLAAKLGLVRGPGCAEEAWRRERVAFIDAFPDDEIDALARAV